jgi:hypothetical protein
MPKCSKCSKCDGFLLSLYIRKGTAGKDLRWITLKDWMYCPVCDEIIEVK